MTQNGTEKERAGRYTKKPITIEAVQYGRRFDWPDWFHDAVSANTVVTHGTAKFADETDLCFCEIKTLEGVMRCNEGDWIIRGVKGELYPCKPDVFAATYEPEQSARRAPVVPKGLKLTEEMHVAAVKVLHSASGLDGLPQRMVDAILAAAPEPKHPR